MIDGEGRRIPWNDVSHFVDDAMRDLMRQIVDRMYTFQVESEIPACLRVIDRR